MVNRPARFTVTDLVRAGKAAKHLGPEWCVEVKPDGSIRLVRSDVSAPTEVPAVAEEKITILF